MTTPDAVKSPLITTRSGARLRAELDPRSLTLGIDTREEVTPEAGQHPFGAIERLTMPTGDRCIIGLESQAVVEIKWSLSDLLAAVGRERERFDKEMQRMLGYPARALIAATTWGELELGQWRGSVSPKAAIGSLIGWAEMGVPVFLVGASQAKVEEFANRFLYLAARRRWRELRSMAAAVNLKGSSHET